jgi:hypothetical protein
MHEGRLEESEDIDVELVPAEKIDALVKSGEISHSLVITALYFWKLSTRA